VPVTITARAFDVFKHVFDEVAYLWRHRCPRKHSSAILSRQSRNCFEVHIRARYECICMLKNWIQLYLYAKKLNTTLSELFLGVNRHHHLNLRKKCYIPHFSLRFLSLLVRKLRAQTSDLHKRPFKDSKYTRGGKTLIENPHIYTDACLQK